MPRPVVKGEPMLPHMTSDWFNGSQQAIDYVRNQKKGIGKGEPLKYQHNKVKGFYDGGDHDRYVPLGILEPMDDEEYIDPWPKLTTAVDEYNWVIPQTGFDANKKVDDVVVWGYTFAVVHIVDTNDKYVWYNTSTGGLESSTFGRAQLLWPNPTVGEPSLILIGINVPTAGLYKTPAGGIPAQSGDVAGSAVCARYQVDSVTGAITAIANSDATIFNPFSGAIGADVYIQAKYCDGVLLVDSEDCGAN